MERQVENKFLLAFGILSARSSKTVSRYCPFTMRATFRLGNYLIFFYTSYSNSALIGLPAFAILLRL
jgi:hypothetical protein